MTKPMKLITDNAKLLAAIASVAKRGIKLDREIQVIACSLVQHIEKHGDYTACQRLVDAIQGKGRKVAMKTFLVTFAKVDIVEKIVEEGGKEKTVEVFAYNKNKKSNLVKAQETFWGTLEPKPVEKPLDFNQRLASAIKAAMKHKEKPIEGDNIDWELVNRIAEIAGIALEEVPTQEAIAEAA